MDLEVDKAMAVVSFKAVSYLKEVLRFQQLLGLNIYYFLDEFIARCCDRFCLFYDETLLVYL